MVGHMEITFGNHWYGLVELILKKENTIVVLSELKSIYKSHTKIHILKSHKNQLLFQIITKLKNCNFLLDFVIYFVLFFRRVLLVQLHLALYQQRYEDMMITKIN